MFKTFAMYFMKMFSHITATQLIMNNFTTWRVWTPVNVRYLACIGSYECLLSMLHLELFSDIFYLLFRICG